MGANQDDDDLCWWCNTTGECEHDGPVSTVATLQTQLKESQRREKAFIKWVLDEYCADMDENIHAAGECKSAFRTGVCTCLKNRARQALRETDDCVDN